MDKIKVFKLGPMEVSGIHKIIMGNAQLEEWPGDLDPSATTALADGNPGAAAIIGQLYKAVCLRLLLLGSEVSKARRSGPPTRMAMVRT